LDNQQINWQLVIQGLKEATKDVQTLQKQLKQVQELKDKAFQTNNTNAYQQLAKLEEDIYRKKLKFEADLTKQKDIAIEKQRKQEDIEIQRKERNYQKYIRNVESEQKRLANIEYKNAEAYTKHIADLKAKQNAESNKQTIKDQEEIQKRNSRLLQSQMEADKYISYNQQLRTLNDEAGKYHQQWKSNVITQQQYNNEMSKLKTQVVDINNKMKDSPNLLGNSEGSSYLGSFTQKLRKVLAA
jgi:hypothetical protein